MGQYFYIVNEDREEYLNPHTLGSGLKFWEICASGDPARALAYLLRESDQGGGGDIKDTSGRVGSWAGDSIKIVGDYDSSELYDKATEEYDDISEEVKEEFNKFIDFEDLEIDNWA